MLIWVIEINVDMGVIETREEQFNPLVEKENRFRWIMRPFVSGIFMNNSFTYLK